MVQVGAHKHIITLHLPDYPTKINAETIEQEFWRQYSSFRLVMAVTLEGIGPLKSVEEKQKSLEKKKLKKWM